MACILGEEHRLFSCRKAAAHHKNVLPGEKLAVTGSAVGNAPANQFLLLAFGFVAMLGTIALSGMIMRNSLILIDQIEQDIKAGHSQWDAILDATVRRSRPIILTALAAVLPMIPLSRSIFFGPMAVAIMGGLIIATLLTLFFLPALYAMWFNVKKETNNV